MEELKEAKEQLAPVFRKREKNFQPNLFTESKQEFSELEKKLVTLVVNQLGYMAINKVIVPGHDIVISVPFSELTAHTHNRIADAAESLQSKRLIYRNDKSQQLDIITPFPRVRFDVVKGRRIIELTMFSAVVPHFAELGQRYTKYDIDVMLSLQSVYAQRMFEIVSMYINRGQRKFDYSVSRLMEMLNCESYNFNDFRKNVLLRAQRELNVKAGIYLDWQPEKEGKKIVKLYFFVKTAKELAVDAVESERQLIRNMPITEAVGTAWQLMKNYKLKDWQREYIGASPELIETFLRVDSELENGLRTNIKNPTAYLIKSLGIDQMKAPAKVKRVTKKLVPEQLLLPVIAPGPEIRLGKDVKLTDIISGIFGK